jgi:hypothetical protein
MTASITALLDITRIGQGASWPMASMGSALCARSSHFGAEGDQRETRGKPEGSQREAGVTARPDTLCCP